MQVHAEVVDHLEQDLEAAGLLPLAWYELLATLRAVGGVMRMHELADELTLSRSAATRFIDRVEQAGLVERRVCPTDRRGMLVALTEAGYQAQKAAARVTLRGLQENFGRHLDSHQTEALSAALTTVLKGQGRPVT